MTIRVLYSCARCALEKAPLDVPERGAEELMVWMDATMECVGRDHRQRSPSCPSGHVDLMIPVPPGAARVGGAVMN